MKTLLTKTISVFLCFVMVFSMAVTAFAAGGTIDATADTKYFQSSSEAENAGAVLDVADEALGDIEEPSGNFKTVLDVLKTLGITVSYNSVNDILKTMDSLSGLDTIFATLGDLSDLNFDVWQKNMKRPGSDTKAIYELIEFLGTTQKKKGLFVSLTNPEIIANAIKGDKYIDFGIAENMISMSQFLGDDGLYGMIKGGLVETVYEKGSTAYNNAYAKTLDNFIYQDLIPQKIGGDDDALPGFSMNNQSTVDTLLTAVLYSAWNEYIVPAIKGLDDSWARDEKGNIKSDLKDFLNVVNFNGASFDASTIKIDTSKSFASQINNLLGVVAKHFVKDASWESGDYTKISKNLNNLLLSVARKLGITTSTTSSETVALEIIKYVIPRIEGDSIDSYVSGIENCKNMKEAAVIVLRNVAKNQNIKVTDDKNATYENLLGDILVNLVEKDINLGYEGGTGKNVWDVLNDIVNIFFFDKGFAKALNLSVKKEDSVFKKLDAFISMTGIFAGLTPAENYKSEGYLKGLIDALFSLDLEKLVDLTVVRFIGDFGEKNAIETVYKFLATTLKSLFGRDILCAYTASDPLNTAIKNESLSNTLKNLLIALNARKNDVVPPILYAVNAFLIKPEIKATAITVTDQLYTGDIAPESVKVKVGGKEFTLKNGIDYTATISNTNAKVGDSVNAVLELDGFVEGKANISYKLLLSPVTNLKAKDIGSTTATLTWDASVGAEKYEIVYGGKVVATTAGTTYKLENVKAGSEVTYSVRALKGSTAAKETSVKFVTLPKEATNIKASSATSTTVKISWNKADGATSYVVSYSADGKKWKTSEVTTNSVTLKSLSSNTTYQVKVKSYNKNTKTYSKESDVTKVTTAPAKVTSLKAKTVTSTTVALSWKKVSGASSYIVSYSTDGKKWKTTKAKKTSLTLKKLTANKKYYFKVQAVKGSLKGDYSSKLTVSTRVAAVKNLKAKSKTKTSVKLSWTKVTGATGYEVYRLVGKKWKKVGTVKKGKTTTYTVKNLKKNTSYKFKVRAVKSKAAGDYSKVLTAKTSK